MPEPPYVAVIFTSVRTDADEEGYAVAAARMEELAATQPGFLGVVSARNGDDRLGLTVSYWTDEEAAQAWKHHPEHLAAQAAGRDHWYERFTVEVATVTHHRRRP